MSHSRFDLSFVLDPDALAITPRLDPADGMCLTLNTGAVVYLTHETARALWGALGASLAPGGPAGPLRTIGVLISGLRFDRSPDVAADFERAFEAMGITVPTVHPALEKDELDEVAPC